jgi:hypothetical protein
VTAELPILALILVRKHLLAAEIFALGDVDHFLGDHAGARPFELRQRMRGDALHRPRRVRETARQMLAAGIAVVDRLNRPAVIVLDAAARLDPFDARAL